MILRVAVAWMYGAFLVLSVSTPVRAQATGGASNEADIALVGNRFRPLEYSELDQTQKAMVLDILEGPRTRVSGPFNVLLRSPGMGNLAQALGAYIRYESVLPPALREMAIIMTAAYWSAEYEWYAHSDAALAAGLAPGIVGAIGEGRRPSDMQADEAILYDFCDQSLNAHRVDENTFQAAIGAFGERGVVDLTGTLGYYSLVSLVLNVDEYPLPDGAGLRFAR